MGNIRITRSPSELIIGDREIAYTYILSAGTIPKAEKKQETLILYDCSHNIELSFNGEIITLSSPNIEYSQQVAERMLLLVGGGEYKIEDKTTTVGRESNFVDQFQKSMEAVDKIVQHTLDDKSFVCKEKWDITVQNNFQNDVLVLDNWFYTNIQSIFQAASLIEMLLNLENAIAFFNYNGVTLRELKNKEIFKDKYQEYCDYLSKYSPKDLKINKSGLKSLETLVKKVAA